MFVSPCRYLNQKDCENKWGPTQLIRIKDEDFEENWHPRALAACRWTLSNNSCSLSSQVRLKKHFHCQKVLCVVICKHFCNANCHQCVLTIALVLHALDSRARGVDVVLAGHKHHRHPLRYWCYWHEQHWHIALWISWKMGSEVEKLFLHWFSLKISIICHHDDERWLSTDQDAESELVVEPKDKVVRPRRLSLVLPLDVVLPTLSQFISHICHQNAKSKDDFLQGSGIFRGKGPGNMKSEYPIRCSHILHSILIYHAKYSQEICFLHKWQLLSKLFYSCVQGWRKCGVSS